MKSPIADALLVLALSLPCCGLSAQEVILLVDPAQDVAVTTGTGAVINAEQKTTETQGKTTATQNLIAGEFGLIKKWEEKYSEYLKETEGFASAIKAGSQVYSESIRIFLSIVDIAKSVDANPSGVFSTASLTDLYSETATELITIYILLSDAIDKGGEKNMLTGEERLRILWDLDDRLHRLGNKLRLLSLSIRYYTLSDVWESATAGMVDRTHGDIASSALNRWQRSLDIANFK